MRSDTKLRTARPTEHLEREEMFCAERAGLAVRGSFEDHEGYEVAMVG